MSEQATTTPLESRSVIVTPGNGLSTFVWYTESWFSSRYTVPVILFGGSSPKLYPVPLLPAVNEMLLMVSVGARVPPSVPTLSLPSAKLAGCVSTMR